MRLRLDWKRYRRELRRPMRTAHGVLREREGLIVRLETPGGAVGFGEACPLEWFGSESLTTIEARLAAMGTDPEIEVVHAVEPNLPCTRFAVECAMVELRGLRLLPPVRVSELPLVALVDLWSPWETEFAPALARGHTTLKCKVGVEPLGREISRLETIARDLPPGVKLRLDANCGFDAVGAEIFLTETASLPIEFLEQPLPAEEIAGLVTLARQFPARVAVEESVRRARDLAVLAQAGWDGPVVVKPSLLGTLALWADAWTRYSWPWVFSSALETRVGASHALAIAFALSREPRALGFGTGAWLPDDGLGGSFEGGSISWNQVANSGGRELWESLG